jgi:ABC-type branched-subunit amino acid transport system ATPase component/ABC-type branched-subunit amino acid transport system permease subunit
VKGGWPSRPAWGAGLFALILVAGNWLPPFYVTLLDYIGLYTLVTLGLVLLTGVAGLTSFGQAAFVGLGAYTSAYLTTAYSVSPWITLVIGLGVTAIIALILGFLTLRLSGHYLPLGTIAWGMSLYFLFGNLDFLGGHTGITDIPALDFFGYEIRDNREFYWLIWVVAAAALVATRNILDSRPGRAIRALRAGVMAEACGVDVARYRIVVFLYAALLASLSGWLYAHLQRFVNPTPFSLGAGIEYLFMAVIGGASQVWGAVIGAAVITVLKQWLQDILPKLLGQSGNFEIIVFGVLIILMLQRARDGLWPVVERGLRPIIARVVPGATAKTVAGPAQALARRERPTAGAAVLEVRAASKNFGGLAAVNGLSFTVNGGEILGLIGPNGAGKSTMFDLISGVQPLDSGEILYRGRNIGAFSSHEIAKLGLARTFQHVKLISTMSALENAALGAHLRGSGGMARAALRLDRAEEAQLLAEAGQQLARAGLGAHATDAAGSLALGSQRLLEIARALAGDPAVLMLDEPAAGLRHMEKQALADLLRALRADGMSLLLVEHDMDFVMGLADRLVVMEFGERLAEGKPAEIRRNPAVLDAYLGGIE